MTSKGKFLLASMLMGVSLAADAAQIQHGDKIPKNRSAKVLPFRTEPTLPKGCKWYHFDYYGNIIHVDDRNTGDGFCQRIALNEESAIRKFKRYKKSLENKRL
jgi:hypothetical protein